MTSLEEPKPDALAQQLAKLPDYMTDANAVLKDVDAEWRYNQLPDYKKTRKYYSETRSKNHAAGSLPELVENLVKNWEIEASFKTRLSDWRTVDFTQYSFAVNDHEPVSASHMLRVGTYNAIIGAGAYYDPNTMDFGASHKTFKRMMPTFAWEVLEVYTEPPVVAFKWRHWGEFREDYSAVNDGEAYNGRLMMVMRRSAGENVKVAANGLLIDITGVTVAHLNERMQVTKLKTWFDSDEMFRQMDPENQAVRIPMVSCPLVGGNGGSTGAESVATGLNIA
ncbi:hypothetical protein E0Z10_g1153 [Xylaria hypoxylon]|uniref:Uncharacterized protein n=1 Tax=Xylaria hypoxylon TaxID=37992 RepID=A0A4Z0Z7X8_9PEZI|nr:hypothetical protein E0Z10_g1153 [Xylaria hypoxylon]